MSQQPTFTIVIPSYNYGHFLPETIESVIAQQRDDVQIIVVDDASQDNTVEVVRRYSDRVEYILNSTNLGAGGAWCVGLERALGRYIIKLDADDQLVPGHLDTVRRAFEQDPGLGIVVSSVWVLHNNSGEKRLKCVSPDERILSAEEFRQKLLGGFFFKMPGCALKKELFHDLDPPDAGLYQIHDWEFILRATRGHKAVLLHNPGAIYRVHDNSITSTANTGDRLYQDIGRWLSAVNASENQEFSRKELDRLKGSCGELMLLGFVPGPNLASIMQFLQNYGRALSLSFSGGIGQTIRMHWSLVLKSIGLLRSGSESRPVVRKM